MNNFCFISKTIIIFVAQKINSTLEVDEKKAQSFLKFTLWAKDKYMKHFLTTALLSALCLPTFAQGQLQIFQTDLYSPERGDMPLIGLGISPNAKYVCGALDQGMGIFIADRETGKVVYQVFDDEPGGELRDVADSGVAIGFERTALLYSFATNEYNFFASPEGVLDILGEGISADGEMVVGTLFGNTKADEMAAAAIAAYKYSGTDWFPLPMPADECFDKYGVKQKITYGKFVSGDGKVILGNIGNFSMPVLWIQNDTGSYDVDFFPERYVKSGVEGVDNTGKPLHSISAMTGLGLSNNGRYVCALALLNLGESDDPEEAIYKNVPVVYDTKEKTLKIYDQDQEIDPNNFGLIPSAIADDGTLVGTIGQHVFGTLGSFILRAGKEQAETFNEAFSEFKEVLGESEELGFNTPTAISPDGQYIVGYTYYASDYMGDETVPDYYVTYVIDTTVGANVETVASSDKDAVVTGYYDISGRRLDNLTKGINIIRKSDGSAQKVIVR